MGTLADRWFQQNIKNGLDQGLDKGTRLRFRGLLWLAVISALGPGCAHGAYEVKIRELSAAAPPGAAQRAAELPFEAEYPVDVYLYGNYPEGLSLDEKNNLVIAPGFEARYTFLAVVTTERSHSGFWWSVFAWAEMHRSHSLFRRVFCAAQTPLRILTGSLWSWVPLNWPCFVDYGSDRVTYQSQELRVVAAAMGANVVVGRVGDTQVEAYETQRRVYSTHTLVFQTRTPQYDKTISGTHVVAALVLDRERPAPKVDPPPN